MCLGLGCWMANNDRYFFKRIFTAQQVNERTFLLSVWSGSIKYAFQILFSQSHFVQVAAKMNKLMAALRVSCSQDWTNEMSVLYEVPSYLASG